MRTGAERVLSSKSASAEAIFVVERRILEMVARGDSLAEILDNLCRFVEAQVRGVLASISLLDGDRLWHGAAPSLPKAYTDAINGAVIGPSAGSCGTAAYRGESVIVEDIASDPLWSAYRDLALPHSLRACWSTPVSPQGKVIATFAMYYRKPRRPTQRDQEIIDHITHLAGVAIQHKLAQEKLQRSEAYLLQTEKLTHTGSWAWDVRTQKVLYCSDEMFRIFGLDPLESLPNSAKIFGSVSTPTIAIGSTKDLKGCYAKERIASTSIGLFCLMEQSSTSCPQVIPFLVKTVSSSRL